MKQLFSISVLALLALSFTSCCSVKTLFGGSCGSSAKVNDNAHCGEYITTTVDEIQTTTYSSAKGSGYSTTGIVTKQVKVPVRCPECITKFKPCEKCCGGVGNEVIRRASAQGWNGNPHIGLIPTMKVLAE